MRRLAVAFLLLAVLPGCAGPAAPLLPGYVERDRRFAEPPAAPTIDTERRILAQDSIGLEDVLALTELLSPDLAVERKDVDLAAVARWEAGLYPNPSIAVEAEDYHPADGATTGRMKRSVGLRIPLPVGGRVAAASAQAEAERDVAAIRYLSRRREILTAARRAFVALLAARRNLDLTRETRDLAKALLDSAEERFRAHAAPEMDVLRASVTHARADLDIRNAERDLAVATRQLQAAVGHPDLPAEKALGRLSDRYALPTLEAARGQVMATHPLLEASRRAEEAAALARDSAAAQRMPDIDLTLKAGRDENDRTIIEGGIELPIPFFNRNQAAVAAAELRMERSQLETKSVENVLLARFTDAYRTLAAAQDRATVYREQILPKAELAVTQTDEAYRLGKFSYLDVLEARRTLADSRIAHLAALSDLNLAAADLDALTGSRLEPLK